MANELQTQYASAGTLYAVILNAAGQAWNTSTLAFENLTGGNWSNYAIALTEQISSGIYLGNFPSPILAGTYSALLRLRAGSSPAVSDQQLGVARITWSGTAEIPLTGFSSLTYGSFK
jgi:hypothetical protein